MAAGIEILAAGGSALDAVEAVIRLVEDNPDDHTVGYGGFPNIDGVVELDAAIIDGFLERLTLLRSRMVPSEARSPD